MVHDRGYLVSQSELDMDLDSFKRTFAPSGDVEKMILLINLLVFFPKDVSVGVKPLRVYVERMAQQQIPKGVCIYQKSMTASANKVIQSLPSKHTLESFQENELLVNITHHVLVPKHEVLSPEEKATLLQRYRLKETQLPRIQHTDPVARYYGLKRGQVVKILRESETAGRYVSYRLCI
ncbi:RNA polymerase Rpb5, C-terminal domain-containing protein [Helicostylum pulchrum]|nr:RNA polymerase Rpb5, C-terminal domain-containing protein [Helicostylum pulchrum]